MKRIHKGINRLPRLIEFQNSRFTTKDFGSWAFHYLTITDTAGNTLLEFARLSERQWETPAGENITVGEMIKRIYRACNPEINLHIYLQDRNPAYPNLMRLNRVFEYRLTLGEMYRDNKNRIKQGYNLDCCDDVKVFHTLKQMRDLKFDN